MITLRRRLLLAVLACFLKGILFRFACQFFTSSSSSSLLSHSRCLPPSALSFREQSSFNVTAFFTFALKRVGEAE